jgi:hypothetical protein
MALQPMILVLPERWKNRPQTSPTLVKKALNGKDHSYNKWTQVCLHQDPYLKTEKRKREPITIPVVDTGGTPESKPLSRTKPKRKRIIGSVTVFETESETDVCDASPCIAL